MPIRRSKPASPRCRIRIDRDKAANLGVSAASIGDTVNTMIGGEIIGKYKDEKEGERYDINARLISDQSGISRRTLNKLRVRSSTGELVRLSEIASIQTGNRPDRSSCTITVSAPPPCSPARTRPSLMGEAMTELNQIVQKALRLTCRPATSAWPTPCWMPSRTLLSRWSSPSSWYT